MEEHSLYTHYLSCRKDVPDRKLSENTKKIIALVESEDFLESNRYMLSDVYTLMAIVYSARADVRYKLELLNGIMEEFKDTEEWKHRGKRFMECYEPFCMAVGLMQSADNVFFTLTKVTRDENNERSYDDNYPEFSSVDEISKYLESHFDEQKDSEDNPEWYIINRHDNNIKKPSLYEYRIEWNVQKRYEYLIKTSAVYVLSKRGTVWKCGIDESNFFDEDVVIGEEICSGRFVADYGDIIVYDSRPFHDIYHVLYAYSCGECIEGLYVEDGKLKTFSIEYHITDLEEFAFELRSCIQEDMSKLSEQESILFRIQQKYHSMSRDDGCGWMNDIIDRIYDYEEETDTEGMPIEMVKEEFLK